MGKTGIRYAAKVSLDKPAAEQDVLHVRKYNIDIKLTLTHNRTVGTRMVFYPSSIHEIPLY
jgi:hypothetical protein